jgi:hypothetical protein
MRITSTGRAIRAIFICSGTSTDVDFQYRNLFSTFVQDQNTLVKDTLSLTFESKFDDAFREVEALDPHHPESGTSTALRAPPVEIQRGVYGRVTWAF